MLKHLAIVPAYNERGAIALDGRDIREHAPDFDVLVVDDGSTDDTADAARAAGAACCGMPFNLGIGGAVQSGYQYALENGYDVAVQVDGDGQHDARHIDRAARPPARAPRRSTWSPARASSPTTRGGYRSSALAPARHPHLRRHPLARSSGRPVTDPTSGFRMVDRRGIELFARDYPHDYPEVEAVLLLHFHQLRGAELPVHMRARTTGVSSINAVALGLLHDQGAAGDLRRPAARAARRRSRATARP